MLTEQSIRLNIFKELVNAFKLMNINLQKIVSVTQ